MEDTLRVYHSVEDPESLKGLNPCFNGRYSQRVFFGESGLTSTSLNPCFNGRYSQSNDLKNSNNFSSLSLNPCFNGRYSQSYHSTSGATLAGLVLILVLMEDTLRARARLIFTFNTNVS